MRERPRETEREEARDDRLRDERERVETVAGFFITVDNNEPTGNVSLCRG